MLKPSEHVTEITKIAVKFFVKDPNDDCGYYGLEHDILGYLLDNNLKIVEMEKKDA